MTEIVSGLTDSKLLPHLPPTTLPYWPASDVEGLRGEHLYLVQNGSAEYENITPRTRGDIGRVSAWGIDVAVAQTSSGIVLPPKKQMIVRDAITTLELIHPEDGMVNYLMDPVVHPTAARWHSLAKRAIALTPLYSPNNPYLGSGIDPGIYHRSIFKDNLSAAAILLTEKPEKGSSIIEKYGRFIETPMDDGVQDSFGLTSADYIRGVPDSHAVRLRAETASEMILKHAIKLIANSPGDRGYQITSLACGAAGPMFTMVPKLHKNGIRVDKVNLVDWDVMALATAKSLAETAGLEDIVEISRRDLLRQDFRDQLKNSDVVDLLGLFEYFPETIGKGRLRYDLASNFLKIVGREMKPGSAIVFGNMLESRPNQVMFNQMWPKLEQRSIPEILRLIAKAGYPPEAVSVRVAPDGIYAVYSITIPEKGLKLPRDPVMQQISKWALLRFVKEY